MAAKGDIRERISALGISKTDADSIADCIVAKRSCSWVNSDDVTTEELNRLGELVKENDYRVTVNVQEIPTRGKYIWEVKALQ